MIDVRHLLRAIPPIVADGVRNVVLSPWHPHRTLHGRPEPIVTYHARLGDLYAHSLYGDPEALARHLAELVGDAVDVAARRPRQSLVLALFDVAVELAEQNRLSWSFLFPALDAARANDPVYALGVRRRLDELEPLLLHEQPIRATFDAVVADLITGLACSFLPECAFPNGSDDDDQPAAASRLTAPLIDLAPDARDLVGRLLGNFFGEDAHNRDPITFRAFQATRNRLFDNVLAASGLSQEQADKNPHKLIGPSDSELTGAALAEAYLAGTPFLALLQLPLPFVIPKAIRFEHTHIIAGTGHGKTQLMQTLLLGDLDDPERPAIVAIDSQGAMLKTIARLERFDPARDDRLVILDPADIEWPLRLNIFDVNRDRLDALPRAEREQILAGIVELYDYIFGALLGAELTQKQSVVFRFLAQFMLAIPNATIHTLRELLEHPKPYFQYLDRVSPTARTFLADQLFDPKNREYEQTRRQVLRRLYGILSNPTFERMFSHPRNAIDMKRLLDGGKVLLVNTAKDVLKGEASAIFGRFVIALIMQAAFERAADPVHKRRPAFIYIDEAAEYFDDNIDTLLIQARKFNVGLVFAHQFLDQLTPGLRGSVMTNPAIRFAGGLSHRDASALAPDMRTTSDFLLGSNKRRHDTQFATFVRHMTSSAIRLAVPLGAVEREPRMTNAAYAQLLARTRAAVAAPIDESTAPAAQPVKVSSAEPAAATESCPQEFADRY